jgi:hypothetical protein
LIWIKQQFFAIRFHQCITGLALETISELAFLGLVPLFLIVGTVWISLARPRKDLPRRRHRYPVFLDLHPCDRSVCIVHLLRAGDHTLRCDKCRVWLADDIAFE